MGKVKILDCTLRDGGFVNDWNFGAKNMNLILTRLLYGGIDVIEVGMLNDKVEFDVNRTIVPKTENFKELYFMPKDIKANIVAMVILGDCPIENIGDAKDTILDGIRIVFKKDKMLEGLEYAKKVKSKGYDIYVQPASITDYNEVELIEMITLFKKLDPKAIYMVDTYGIIENSEFLYYYYIYKNHIEGNQFIGYHAHDNLNLAYANCVTFIKEKNEKNIYIDSSIMGMGKNAGNTKTELIANHLNVNYGYNYGMHHILEIFDPILKFKEKYEWGYSLENYLSAKNRCHPTYVKTLLKKNTLCISQVNEILKKYCLNKTSYDEVILSNIYKNYTNKTYDSTVALNNLYEKWEGKNIIIMCPGNSLVVEEEKINSFIKQLDAIVISCNFIPKNYDVDYVFFTNQKRYEQAFYSENKKMANIKFIATSNVFNENTFEYIINFNDFRCETDDIATNSAIIMVKILNEMGVNHAYMCGFDGYTSERDYLDTFTELPQKNDINNLIKKEYNKSKKGMKIEHITKSIFDGKNNND